MEGPRILKHEHFHSIGVYNDTPSLEEIKKERVEILL